MLNGKFDASDIYALLFRRYSDERQWLCATEVADSTGWAHRRLDFVAANCYEGEGYGVHAFEVKISKSDLRRELMEPEKHNVFFDDVDTYSIVAPDYVLDAEYVPLIPKNWGIIRAIAGKGEDGQNMLKTVRKPIPLHDVRSRSVRRAFAFGLIRSMKGAFKERNEIKGLLAAEYARGLADGRKELNGTDWRKLYEERQTMLERMAHALRRLGVDPWRGVAAEGLEHFVESRVKEIERNEHIARFVGSVKWEAQGLDEIAKRFREVVSPIIEAAQKAKKEVGGEG